MNKRHTGTKTAWLVSSIASALLVSRLPVLLVLLVAWIGPWAIAAGAARGLANFTLRLIAPTYAMLLLVYALIVVPPNVEPDFNVGPLGLYVAGAVHATTIAARLTAIGAASIGFGASTSPVELASSLRVMHVPAPAAAAFTASFALLSIVRRKMATIIEAQRSRAALSGGNLFRRARAYVVLLRPLTFALMLGAVDRATVWNHRGLLSAPLRRPDPLTYRDGLLLFASAAILSCAGFDRWVF